VTGRCPEHAAHRPLAGASAAELLEALVNGWCLSAIVPLALDAVECDLSASGGRFPGDLLRGLMEVPGAFWGRYPRLYDRYQAALRASAAARRRLPAEQRMAFWAPLDPGAVRVAARDAIRAPTRDRPKIARASTTNANGGRRPS
jgi:hypothetical protein